MEITFKFNSKAEVLIEKLIDAINNINNGQVVDMRTAKENRRYRLHQKIGKEGVKYNAYLKTIYVPFDNDLQNLQYRDLFYTKIPRALRFNDRISMMHSTELREPFLDYRFLYMFFL